MAGSEEEGDDKQSTPIALPDAVPGPSFVTSKTRAWKESGTFQPIIHDFNNTHSGFRSEFCGVNDDSSILDFFECFVTSQLASKIAFESNRYYEFVMKPSVHSRPSRWKLIARNPKLSLSDCWSKDPLLHTPIFSDRMPRDRYLLLLRLLHFFDNTQQVEGDRLYKLEMVVREFRKYFAENFVPFQTLCIDESMVPFKGRLPFKRYIKGKRHKYGVKMFMLADAETDYILNFIIYLGSATKWPIFCKRLEVTGSSVVSLMRDYLNKGHTLYTDNWYTSISLAKYLHKNELITTVLYELIEKVCLRF